MQCSAWLFYFVDAGFYGSDAFFLDYQYLECCYDKKCICPCIIRRDVPALVSARLDEENRRCYTIFFYLFYTSADLSGKNRHQGNAWIIFPAAFVDFFPLDSGGNFMEAGNPQAGGAGRLRNEKRFASFDENVHKDYGQVMVSI